MVIEVLGLMSLFYMSEREKSSPFLNWLQTFVFVFSCRNTTSEVSDVSFGFLFAVLTTNFRCIVVLSRFMNPTSKISIVSKKPEVINNHAKNFSYLALRVNFYFSTYGRFLWENARKDDTTTNTPGHLLSHILRRYSNDAIQPFTASVIQQQILLSKQPLHLLNQWCLTKPFLYLYIISMVCDNFYLRTVII